jgi:D-tagatose-1,6-bisphosphate aldolase subunit GatZ/KbaZ
VVYKPERARELSAALNEMPGLVFEAHSTDYQPPDSLARLVEDGFAILKVGPGLTFALREALYALDQIAAALYPGWCENSLMAVMEAEMVANPAYWQSHYRGDPAGQRVLRHFSYSDRIRYYWAFSAPQEAVRRLLDRLRGTSIPEPLISQFLPTLYPRVASGALDPVPKTLVLEAVRDVLRVYAAACGATNALGRQSVSGSGGR